MGLWADIKGITGLGGTAGFLKVSTAGAISVDPGGSGDVTGPAGATADHLAVFADATGKILKDGGAPGAGGISQLDGGQANAIYGGVTGFNAGGA